MASGRDRKVKHSIIGGTIQGSGIWKIIEEEEVKDTIQEMSQNQNVPDMSAEVEELSRKELHEDKLGDHKLTVKFQNTRDEDERV